MEYKEKKWAKRGVLTERNQEQLIAKDRPREEKREENKYKGNEEEER